MAYQQKIGVRWVPLALGVLAASALLAGRAIAQEPIQQVEITGSSIKRIAVEGALPIQHLTQEAIARSGAANIAELIQALPAMQGFTISAIAAGANTGGRVSASIHGIGENYTLVLLNGRRLAPQGAAPQSAGSTVNLNAIPMSAVERIEILTDGASAIYGSDAIAGVVNFILKKNLQGGSAEASYNAPEASGGGKSWNSSLSYGFGNLGTDRFNVLMAYRHDALTELKATDREFAKTAYLPFTHQGTNYISDRTSTATVPANVVVSFNGGLPTIGFSPYLKQNGTCPELNFASLTNTATTANCAFDFAATVKIVPESTRDSLFAKGTFQVTNSLSLFSDVAFSRYDTTARIAPNVAPFSILPSSAYYRDYVLPYLSAQQANNVKAVSGSYRTYDWGTRDSQTVTDSSQLVLGAEGELGAWNFNTGLTWSRNAIDERFVGGYARNKEFRDMLANRSFDPFAAIGSQTPEAMVLIQASLFSGSIRTASTTLRGVDAHGSRELFDLRGGKASIAVGADYRQYAYEQRPSAAVTEGLIYNFVGVPTYDMTRTNYGVFGELLAPLTKELELTLAARHDQFSAIDDAIARRTIGTRQHASTYKVSARYQPTQMLLLRGSYGTGFKVPGMLEIAQPLAFAGVTPSAWNCPVPHQDYCRPGIAQYNVLTGGNEALKPERSRQFTLGLRIDPSAAFSFGADLWDVEIRDAVSAITPQQAFGDPVKFRHLFTPFAEPSTGNTYWAFLSLAVNSGRLHNRGIDWDMTGRHKFGFGTFTANVNGTHLLISDYTTPGTDNVWTTNMNKFGINDAVSFRDQLRFTGSLETGAYTNSITVNYRNGYVDAEALVRNLSTNKNELLRLDVPSYTTVDWQGRYIINKAASVRAGIKNLLNVAPPLSLRASFGHQNGFDPRYADPMLRSFYLAGSYKF
jgi:iron complex outermembrane receptor protein